MHEHVGRVEPVDGLVQRHVAQVLVDQLPAGGLRIVEQRLHTVTVDLPGRDRVLGHARPAGQLDAGTGGEEGREPADQVTHHVAGRPAGHRRGGVPGPGRADAVGERTRDVPVPLSGAEVQQCHWPASSRIGAVIGSRASLLVRVGQRSQLPPRPSRSLWSRRELRGTYVRRPPIE